MMNFSPEQYAAFWTAVGAIAAVAASIVAIITLLALRRDSADRTRPMMTAELKSILLVTVPHRSLVLRNVGATTARQVTVEFDPALPPPDSNGPEGLMTPILARRYASSISTWPPGMALSNIYFAGEQQPDGTWANREPLPDQFTVTINYKDEHGRAYSDNYTLDDSIVRLESFAEPGSWDEKTTRKREVRAFEELARQVGNL